MNRFMMLFVGCAFALVVLVVCEDDEEEHGGRSFSFYKFKGPVSGEVERIVVADGHNGQKYDYRAKPDYSFSYGVTDSLTGNSQERQESRDGDTVHGQYRVLQPDGTTRIVRYTADARNGFQASVEYH